MRGPRTTHARMTHETRLTRRRGVSSSGRSSEPADWLYMARSAASGQALKMAGRARFAETRSGGRKNCLESAAISIP